MKFERINFNKGELLYVGEGRCNPSGWTSFGAGALCRTKDKKIVVCEMFDEDLSPKGMGFEYFPETKTGTMGHFDGYDPIGPSLVFKNEVYVGYRNYHNNKFYGFTINAFANGNYVIYENNGVFPLKGIGYYDGILYFVELDQDYKVTLISKIKELGSQYKYTLQRMFAMPMDYDRYIVDKDGTTSDGERFSLSTQVLTEYSKTYWGYGAIKWSGGGRYVGEWYDGYREGIGVYKLNTGTYYLGKFYKNKRTSTCLCLFENGIKRMGNFSNGKREGIHFEIYDDCVVIINYQNDDVYGNKFQVYKDCNYVSEFNSSGNVGRYYR